MSCDQLGPVADAVAQGLIACVVTGEIAVRHAGDAAGPVGSTVSDLSDDHGPLVGPGSRDGAHTGAPRPCMERKCVAVRKCERWLCSNRPRSRVSVPQDPYRKM